MSTKSGQLQRRLKVDQRGVGAPERLSKRSENSLPPFRLSPARDSACKQEVASESDREWTRAILDRGRRCSRAQNGEKES